MKKLTSLCLCVLIVLSSVTEFCSQEVCALSAAPELTAESAVLIEYTSGKVLFDKNKDAKMFPASTTKVLTGLIVLENLDMKTVVTIDAETAKTTGSRIYLSEGEQVTVEQLVYALLLYSANDAAVALARTVSGSVEEFAVLMNKRAKEIGAQNSNFVNPNGLPDENHYTTAYDLAIIAREAMQNEAFRKIVGTYQYVIPQTEKYQERVLKNTNRLLWDTQTKMDAESDRTLKYDGVTGIKTGYTNAAGNCLVAGAERSGAEFIAVVLKGTDKTYFPDTIRLLDYAFNNYYFKCLNSGGVKVGSIKVKGSRKSWAEVVSIEDVGAIVSIDDDPSKLTHEVHIDEKIQAPFEAGEKAGTIKLYRDGELVKEYELVTTEGAEASSIGSFFQSVRDGAPAILKVIAIIIAAILILYLLLIIAINIKMSKKKKARRKRRRR